MKILILTIQTDQYKPVNNFYVPRSLIELGHEVTLGDVDTLMMFDNVIHVKAGIFTGGVIGDRHVAMEVVTSCEDFDLIWILDYAHPSREREFFQILWVLERRVPFVNRPSSMFFLNNKIGVLGLEASKHFAPTNLLLNQEIVSDIVAREPGSTWVLKPANSGCGIDVYMIKESDPNCGSLIQSATGNIYQKYEMYTREGWGRAEKYTILQKFIPGMQERENRVIIAGGKIVGGYKKTATGNEFRGNITTGGALGALNISPEARELCVEIGRELATYGIHYAGIDVAYPFIVEYNLVNPGGIGRQIDATGEDIGIAACEAAVGAAMQSARPAMSL
ncbi:ATP-grasp domain-containing protein [Sphingomonas sp. Leaf242]|uniref:ATP-grasp domain-containing protein n=1 Tax=Sphingomonas sp. Leaf242 TaxID=1736304 RepID=UPI0009E7CCDD|nr:hypothetical protein [Sphingomonas sp. Leaf242]